MFKITAPSAHFYGIDFGPYPTRQAAREDLSGLMPAVSGRELDELARRVIVPVTNMDRRQFKADKDWCDKPENQINE